MTSRKLMTDRRRPCRSRPRRRRSRRGRRPGSRGGPTPSASGASAAPAPGRRQRRPAEVPRAVAQLVLDPEQPVVLRDALGARRRAGLDLAGARSRRRGRRSSCPPSRPSGARRRAASPAARERDRLDRLGQRADLVELDEHGVRGALPRSRARSAPRSSRAGRRRRAGRGRRAAASARAQPSQSSSARPSSSETIG